MKLSTISVVASIRDSPSRYQPVGHRVEEIGQDHARHEGQAGIEMEEQEQPDEDGGCQQPETAPAAAARRSPAPSPLGRVVTILGSSIVMPAPKSVFRADRPRAEAAVKSAVHPGMAGSDPL